MLKEKGFITNFQVSKSDDEEQPSTGTYDYLLSMPLYSLSKERVEDLQRKIKERQQEIYELEKQTVEDLWLKELDKFADTYISELKERD